MEIDELELERALNEMHRYTLLDLTHICSVFSYLYILIFEVGTRFSEFMGIYKLNLIPKDRFLLICKMDYFV